MARTNRRKTERGSVHRSVYERGMELVRNEKRTVRSVAAELKIDITTLIRFIKKASNAGTENARVGYFGNRRILSDLQEEALEIYLLNAATIYFGLTPYEVRKIAFECAHAFGVDIPPSWSVNNLAGVDWFNLFMKRHPNLSVRKPEATSLSRTTSFNKYNVDDFFAKLFEVVSRYTLTANDLWNVDETRNIVADKGVKQIGAVTSAERGSLVCGAINAIGNSIPPMLIFPRKHYKGHFIRKDPTGSVGTANPLGWMTEDTFLEFMNHFVKHVKPTTDKPVLLLLDNHYSHLDLQILLYAKANGIVMLSFPPHCSHKLQPLDRTVYGPLKRYVSTAQDEWMRAHPGIPMTIYDIPGILKKVWHNAFSSKYAANGFEVTGYYNH